MPTPRIVCLIILLACGLAAVAVPMPGNTIYLEPATRSTEPSPTLTAHRAKVRLQEQRLERFRQRLVRMHALSPRAAMPWMDTFVMPAEARRSAPVTRAAASYGNGTLTFAFEGWSAADEQQLRTFLATAYPVLENIYGKPATSGTLTLVAGGYYYGIESGEFNPTTMRMTLPPLPDDFATTDYSQYAYELLHMVLHAFRAPVIIGVDAWEEGMTRAAAMIAAKQLRPDLDPELSFAYYLNIYDMMNQPALSNATFFPGQGILELNIFRMGMAYSAWLKAFAENGTIFKAFNEAYYLQVAANPSAAGNATLLKGIMAGVVATVEGAPFMDWFARQYALQNTSMVGRRMFVFSVPLHENIPMYVFSVYTNADGTEQPQAGTVSLAYSGFDNVPLYPEEESGSAYQLQISSTGDTPGWCSTNPTFMNIGETAIQRIRITITLNTMQTVLYYPFRTRGEEPMEGDESQLSEYYGSVIGADTGTMRIYTPNGALPETQVVQGAFSANMPTGRLISLDKVRFVYRATDGKETTFYRNVGPAYCTTVFRVDDGGPTTLRRTFTAGLALVSFPIVPNEADAAVLFSQAANSPNFKMAWWDPALTEADKYRRYPAVPAITVGRGYWLQLPANQSIDITGVMPSTDDARSVELKPGWNLIGNAYNATVNPWVMTVQAGAMSYTLSEAAMRHNIISPIWTYNGRGGYEVKNELVAWEGGWIYNNTGGTLVLRQQGASRAATRTASDPMRALTEGGWGLNVRARSLTGEDSVIIGATQSASRGIDGRDWLKPPAFGDGVRMALVHPDRRSLGGAYASDIRAAGVLRDEEWIFEVTSTVADQVTLCWPDLREVPQGYQLVLEDLTNGTLQYLRTTAVYTYQANGSAQRPDTRKFRLAISTQRRSPLSFVSLQVMPSRGEGGASVRVVLNAAAEVMMEVRSTTGKLLHRARVPATRANEAVLIPWNGRGLNGKRVPSGTYLLQFTARTADGYLLRRTQTTTIGR